MKVAALIPAKATSERCPGKNQRELAGKPLFVWSILQAQACPSIDEVWVSTDSQAVANMAFDLDCIVLERRPEHAGPLSPDIDWITHVLNNDRCVADVFVLLRPTSPFRTPQTIEAALSFFLSQPKATSLRAVRKVTEHPAKQWLCLNEAGRIGPLMKEAAFQVAWTGGHREPWSQPYQALPTVYVQDSSLEIAHRATYEAGSLTGSRVLGWEQPGVEGHTIDSEDDWAKAEQLVEEAMAWVR